MTDQHHPPDLEEISFLAELPDKRRRFLASRLKIRRYPAGSQIIRQGRKGGFFAVVAEGRIQMEDDESQPRELESGDCFGSAMLLYGKTSGFTVTALEDTVLWVLQQKDWQSPTVDPPPPRKPLLKPGQLRALTIGILVTAGLAMFAWILGPALLDRTTAVLPGWLVDRGRPQLAESYLRSVAGWQPEAARNFGYLGDILVLEGKDREAIEAYQQALELDEYLPWIHNNLGVLLLEDGQAETAADHFQQAIELSPQTIPAYVNLGTAYYKLEDWEAAAAAYGQALELDFSLLDTKAAWAGLIISESRLVEARLVWEDVLLQDPRHPLALQGLGVVSLLENDPSLAMMYFDAAGYFTPADPALHLYMGMALQALEKPADAAQAYRFAANNGTNPQLISLARALLEVVSGADSGENEPH
jgi:tetratricopeptide (TPR) repeat protein